jgi:hypothetical protein
LGAGGRRFESCHPDKKVQSFKFKNFCFELLRFWIIGPVAQGIEQLISNQSAAGSIPAGITNEVTLWWLFFIENYQKGLNT